MTNQLLIIGVAVFAVVVLFVAGAVLTAWTYAKSCHVQLEEELVDNGTFEV